MTQKNIGVIGNSGVGKSSFINALLNLSADDEGAAPVGSIEATTQQAIAYAHPKMEWLLIWDLPGVVTSKLSRHGYFEEINFERYDFFILLSANRFTENDAWLVENMYKNRKPFFVVRTKMSIEIEKDKLGHQKTHNKENVIKGIRNDIEKNVTEICKSMNIVSKALVFLVDSYNTNEFDFRNLIDHFNNGDPTMTEKDFDNSLCTANDSELLLSKDEVPLAQKEERKGVEEFFKFFNSNRKTMQTSPFNIAVIGRTGVGKSTFINAMLNVSAEDERAAPVGNHQAAVEPTPYGYPDNETLILWELPNVDSPQFPKSTYFEQIMFEQYDIYLVLTANHFSKTDTWLVEKLHKNEKRFFVVRTSMSIEISKDKMAHPKMHDKESVIENIRSDIAKTISIISANMGDDAAPKALIFLVDSYHTCEFDFGSLVDNLINTFRDIKQEAVDLTLNRALAVSTSELVLSKEDEKLAEKSFKKGGVDAFVKFMIAKQDNLHKTLLNIAVIGNSGVGKSSFINAMLNMNTNDKGAAPVGVNQTTMAPTPFAHPDREMLIVWDLPGVGTREFPRATYLDQITFKRYDFFIVITATRFTDNDAWLAEQIRHDRKRFFFVRTKMQLEIDNDKQAHPKTHKTARDTEVFIETIRNDIKKNLSELRHNSNGEQENETFFLIDSLNHIDSHNKNDFDFDALIDNLIERYPEIKKDSLIMSLNLFTEGMIKKKVKVLRRSLWWYAFVAGTIKTFDNELIPTAMMAITVAGLPEGAPCPPSYSTLYTTQNNYLAKTITSFAIKLGIDRKSLEQLSQKFGVKQKKLEAIVEAELPGLLQLLIVGDTITIEFLKAIGASRPQTRCAQTGIFNTIKNRYKFLKSVIKVPISFDTTYYSLTTCLDKFESISLQILQGLIDGSLKDDSDQQL